MIPMLDVGVRRTLAVAVLTFSIPAAAAAQTAGRPADTAAAAPAIVAEAGPDGFGLRSADGAFRLRLQGLVHYDARAFLNDDDDRAIDGFDLRRLRSDLRGTVLSRYDFRLHLDYAGSKVEILDAYVDGRFSPAAQLRVGKFKAPVGLERLQSGSAVTFAERAFPTALVPNRDVGVQLQGTIGGSRLSYAAGVFNGVPDGSSGDTDLSDSKDLAGRIFVQPFGGGPAALSGLGVGIAGTVGDQRGSATASGLPSLRTPIGRSTFLRFRSDGTADGSAVLDGRRTRISPQGSWYWGPAGLLAEYVRSSSEVRLGDETDQLDLSAWQVTASWFLTGEAASYRGATPRRPFSRATGGLGAFELAGRIHEIEIEADAFPRFANPAGGAAGATGIGVGLNWYLDRFVRLQANWERTRFDAAEPGASLPHEDIFITRVQLAF